MTPAERVRDRSGGRCEALVYIRDRVWTRCFDGPVEVHHRLTRGRGGAVLDELGETYHLLALCPAHHRAADGEAAYAGGLLLDGAMIRDGVEHYYTGTDPYLSERYGRGPRVQGFTAGGERPQEQNLVGA